MTVLDAGIQSRPIRHAVILPPACSKRKFGQIVEALCTQWGGVQSIILPASDLASSPLWRQFLELRDPDLVLLTTRTQEIQSFLNQEVNERRICPAAITSSWHFAIVGSSVLVNHIPDISRRGERILVDLRRYGYDFGQAAQYGISPEAELKAVGLSRRVSVARFRRMIRTGSYPRPQTAVDLSARRAAVNVRPRLPIVFIGDPNRLSDACAFWNLRALLGTGRVQWMDFVDDRLDKTTSYATPYGTFLAFTAYSLQGTEYVGEKRLSKLMEPSGGASVQYRPLDDYLPRPADAPEWRPRIEAASIELGQIVLSRPLPAGTTPVVHGARWAVDVELRDPAGSSSLLIRPPFHVTTNALLKKPGPQGRPGTARASRIGMTVLLSADPSEALIRLQIPDIDDILTARCDSARLTFSISDKGSYSARSVAIFDGLSSLAALLRDDMASPILQTFMLHHQTGTKLQSGERRYLTLTDMQEAVVRHVTGSKRQLRKARREQLGEQVSNLVASLIRKGVLQPGAIFHCPHCGDLEWYHASQFSDQYTCRRCLEPSTCGPSPEWRYHLHESVFLGYWNNMRAPILALDVLRSQARISFAFTPEIRFEHESGARQEADIVACSDGELVIGEAKTTSHIDHDQIAQYEDLCRRLGAAKLVFAVSERSTAPCKKHLCDNCRSADEAFSHGNPDDESNWGTRERIKALRKKLDPLGITVNSYCPQVLDTGELPYLSFING